MVLQILVSTQIPGTFFYKVVTLLFYILKKSYCTPFHDPVLNGVSVTLLSEVICIVIVTSCRKLKTMTLELLQV